MLLDPPPEVRDVCRAGLAERDRRRLGGTAAAVAFAMRASSGGPLTEHEVQDACTAHRALLAAEAAGALGDPAITVSRKLWGGEPGREWAETLVWPPPPPLLAATPAELPVLAALNALAAGEATLAARALERLEAGVEAAVSRARARVVTALGRPSAALKASLGGASHGPAILAAMRVAPGDAAALAAVPPAALAVLLAALADNEMLSTVLFPAVRACEDIAAGQQEAVRAALAPVLSAGEADALRDAQGDDRAAATRLLAAAVLDVAVRAISGGAGPLDPDEGEQAGTVAPSLVGGYLDACGGGDFERAGQGRVSGPAGELLVSGIALGRRCVAALAAAAYWRPASFEPGPLLARGPGFTTTLERLGVGRPGPAQLEEPEQEPPFRLALETITTWRWGSAPAGFAPHIALDGVEWADERGRERACTGTGGFPFVSVMYPGDHRGCSCRYDMRVSVRVLSVARLASDARAR